MPPQHRQGPKSESAVIEGLQQDTSEKPATLRRWRVRRVIWRRPQLRPSAILQAFRCSATSTTISASAGSDAATRMKLPKWLSR